MNKTAKMSCRTTSTTSTTPSDSSTQEPKSMKRAKVWSEEVEDLFRFQEAGYRDEVEYRAFNNMADENVERWPDGGFVRKLKRKDGLFYYFMQQRECANKDINKCKIYAY